MIRQLNSIPQQNILILSSISLMDLGDQLGFTPVETGQIAAYLQHEGLLKKVTFQNVSITHWGIKEIEAALSKPDQPTQHFPAINITYNIDGDQISVGNVDNISSMAIGRQAQSIKASDIKDTLLQAQGDITIDNSDINVIDKVFSRLYQSLDQIPDSPKKALAEHAMQGLEAEAVKGEQADEEKVKEWFTGLMAMLPDIGEVAINTFINPITGLSTVFQKVAKKAQEAQKK